MVTSSSVKGSLTHFARPRNSSTISRQAPSCVEGAGSNANESDAATAGVVFLVDAGPAGGIGIPFSGNALDSPFCDDQISWSHNKLEMLTVRLIRELPASVLSVGRLSIYSVLRGGGELRRGVSVGRCLRERWSSRERSSSASRSFRWRSRSKLSSVSSCLNWRLKRSLCAGREGPWRDFGDDPPLLALEGSNDAFFWPANGMNLRPGQFGSEGCTKLFNK